MKRFKVITSLVLPLVMMIGVLSGTGSSNVSATEEIKSTALTDAEIAAKVKEIVDNMTLEEKIGQKLMLSFRSGWTMQNGTKYTSVTEVNPEIHNILGTYDIGSAILFAVNFSDNPEVNVRLTNGLQEAAMDESLGENSIPLLIAADQEGGSVYRLTAGTALSGNMALAATRSLEDCYDSAAIIGGELEAVGVNVNFAPVADVNNNPNNPVIGLRSFSSTAQLAADFVGKYIEGVHTSNVATTAKHFPGHGNTVTDSHSGLPSIGSTLEELYKTELVPFKAAIGAGTDMIMTAHIQFPNVVKEKIYSAKKGEFLSPPATLSREILTDLLRGEMDFKGVIVTDSMTMDGVAAYFNTNEANLYAVKAGVDILDIPFADMSSMSHVDGRLASLIDAFVAAYTSEKGYNDIVLSSEELNESVARILTLKYKRGIMDLASETTTYEEKIAIAKAEVGSAENHEIEREVAAHGITVVKNIDNTLPLTMTSESKVLMLCPYTNEIVQASMAWNRAIQAGLIPKGADFKVIRFESKNTNIATAGTGYNSDGTSYTGTIQQAMDWADTVIVTSEVSSANNMAYNSWLSSCPNIFVNYAEENEKRTVIMSVDKPYDVQLYPNADTILATYGCKGTPSSVKIPESIGGGVTNLNTAYGPNIIAGYEVAFGTFGATGTLPVDVPLFDNSVKKYTDQIVYSLGYGITYDSLVADADKTALDALINEVGALNSKLFTEESWAAAEEALEALEQLLVQAVRASLTIKLSQNNVDVAYDELKAALDAVMEILVYDSDKTALNTLISEAEELDSKLYTEESWAAFAQELKDAKEIAATNSVKQEDIDAAYNELKAALNTLVEKIDSAELKKLIAEVEKMDLSKYTEKSVASLNTALKAAKEVLNDASATQKQVDEALVNLTAAKKALVENGESVNTSELKKLITEVEKMDLRKYTEKSVASLNKALEAAKKVLNDTDATQKQVDEALVNLTVAKKALVEKDDTDSPKTGDYTNISFLVFALTMSAVGIVVLASKKKRIN